MTQDLGRTLAQFLADERAKYDEVLEQVEDFARRLESAVRTFLAARLSNRHINVRVVARAKSWPSTSRKLEESALDVLQMPDLVGLRVVVLFRDDIDAVEEALDEVLGESPPPYRLNQHWNDDIGRSSGYSSLHRQSRLLDGKLLDQPEFLPSFELQIRTELEDSWAELTHSNFYKSPDGIPYHTQLRLKRLAASLNLLDSELQAIKKGAAPELERIKRKIHPDSLEWHGMGIDEATLKRSSSSVLTVEFKSLRELGRRCGLRHSDWTQLVDVGNETDVFTSLVGRTKYRTLQDLIELIKLAQKLEPKIKEVVDAAKRSFEESGSKFSMFDRPLLVLTIALLLQSPGLIETSRLRDEIKDALTSVVLNGGPNHK